MKVIQQHDLNDWELEKLIIEDQWWFLVCTNSTIEYRQNWFERINGGNIQICTAFLKIPDDSTLFILMHPAVSHIFKNLGPQFDQIGNHIASNCYELREDFEYEYDPTPINYNFEQLMKFTHLQPFSRTWKFNPTEFEPFILLTNEPTVPINMNFFQQQVVSPSSVLIY
jgi:hypothetical protein